MTLSFCTQSDGGIEDMIQGDCLARLFSFSFTPALGGKKMSFYAIIGEIFQSKQSKLEKLMVYSEDHCHHKL